MLGAVRHSAAQAVSRAGVSRLLPSSTWSALLAAEDLEDLLGILAGTAYRTSLLEAPAEPGVIARRLRGALVVAQRKPRRFLRGAPRDLVDWTWRRHEIENLAMVLRGLHAGLPAAEIRRHLLPLAGLSRIDWRDLAAAGSVADLGDRLGDGVAGRFYARVLENGREAYERQGEVFVLENALHRAYYGRLGRKMAVMTGRDGRDARRVVGLMLDSRNVLWAYRFRLLFELPPETVLEYTLPRGVRATTRVMQDIATGAPIAATARRLWGPDLVGLDELADLEPAAALTRLELLLRRLLERRMRAALQGYPFRLATVLAHGILLEHEVRDLVTLVESRASMSPAEALADDLIGERGAS